MRISDLKPGDWLESAKHSDCILIVSVEKDLNLEVVVLTYMFMTLVPTVGSFRIELPCNSFLDTGRWDIINGKPTPR